MKYRHLRRTVIAVLATFAFLLIAGWLVVSLLNSTPVRTLSAAFIERVVERRFGAELEIGELRWALMPPRVLLRGLRLKDSGLDVEIDDLSLDLLRLRLGGRELELGSVVADGVRVRVTEIKRTGGSSPLRISMRHLDLRNVDFEGVGLPGIDQLSITDLDLSGARDAGRTRGYFKTGELRLAVDGIEDVSAQISGRFDITDDIVVPFWSARGRGFEMTGRGSMSNGEVRAQIDGRLDLSELDRTIRTEGLLAGDLQFQARVASNETKWIHFSFVSPTITVAGFGLGRVRGSLNLESDGLSGELENADFVGGHLRGQYRLGALAAPYPHSVRAVLEDASLGDMLREIGVPPASLTAKTSAVVDLDWNSEYIGQGSGLARVRFQRIEGGLPVTGGVEVRLGGDDNLHFLSEGLEIGVSRVQWQGPLAIGSWAPQWSVRAEQAPIDDWVYLVNSWIGDHVLPPELTGMATISSRLSGPWTRLRVATRIDAEDVGLGPIRMDRVVADTEIGESILEIQPARFSLGDGFGQVDGRISWKGEAPLLDLAWRGQSIPLAEIAAWIEQPAKVSGDLSFAGTLRGSPSAVQGSWAAALSNVEIADLAFGNGSSTVALDGYDFALTGLSFDSGIEGRIEWNLSTDEVMAELRWPGFPLTGLGDSTTRVIGRSATLETTFQWLGGRFPEGWLRLFNEHGEIDLDSTLEGIDINATVGDSLSIQAQLDARSDGALVGAGSAESRDLGVLSTALLAEHGTRLEGSAEAIFDIQWFPETLPEISGSIETRELVLGGTEIVQLAPLDFKLDQAGLVIESTAFDIDGDTLAAEAEIGSDGRLEGRLDGTWNAVLFRVVLPEWETAGRVSGELELQGTIDTPRLVGGVQINSGSFRVPGGNSVVSGVNGLALLSADALVFEGIDFRFMSGVGRGSGQVSIRDSETRLALNGTIKGLVYPLFSGFSPQLSGSWRLTGPADDLELSGDLRIDRATFSRKDSLEDVVLDWIAEADASAPEDGLRLDLHLTAERSLAANSPFLNALASASLDLFGTLDDLGLVGKIELHDGGDFTFQGVRYEIERGSLAFTDPQRMDRPIVDFEARAWVQSYQITVRLSGALDRLVTVVSSDPPLDPEGIYSLLSLGYRDESIGTGGFGMGLASTLLTRQLTEEFERRARLVLPIDQFRVDPFVESSTGNPAARMTVTKQLSPKWTVILQSNLSSDREEVLVSRWYLAPGVFVEAIRDLDGTIGIDLKLRKRY